MALKRTEAFERGYDAGNYAYAYETRDWYTWWADHCADITSEEARDWAHGAILGFFSSLEIHEISDDDLADEVAALRVQYGES